MSETLLKPSILPESPETVTLVDDQTVTFRPQFGRGWTQRNSYADPRWRVRRRYKAMRAADVSQLLSTLQDAQGAFKSVRAAPSYLNQGSFSCPELFLNNDFATGTTSWTTQSSASATVNNGVYRYLRLVSDGTTANTRAAIQSITATAYLPYCCRYFVQLDGGLTSSQVYRVTFADGIDSAAPANFYSGNGSATASGLRSSFFVPGVAGSYSMGVFGTTTTDMANDFQSVLWASLARCALVDASPNFLLQSDDLTTSWTNANTTDAANTTTDPNGGSTADSLIEDATASSQHYIHQNITMDAATGDLCATACFKAGTRTWAAISVVVDATAARCYYNLSSGAMGTVSTGASWANTRAYIVSLGNGWYRCYLISRKTTATTTVNVRLQLASGDNGALYNGDGSSLIYVWRAGASPGGSLSSVANNGAGLPFIPAATTTAATTTGTAPAGTSMRVKGLTASTNGLLLPGDFFEINGELKQVTSSVNSDAAGCALINFRPALHVPATNNDIVNFNKPLGTFQLTDGASWDATFGAYLDSDLTLDEVFA